MLPSAYAKLTLPPNCLSRATYDMASDATMRAGCLFHQSSTAHHTLITGTWCSAATADLLTLISTNSSSIGRPADPQPHHHSVPTTDTLLLELRVGGWSQFDSPVQLARDQPICERLLVPFIQPSGCDYLSPRAANHNELPIIMSCQS